MLSFVFSVEDLDELKGDFFREIEMWEKLGFAIKGGRV